MNAVASGLIAVLTTTLALGEGRLPSASTVLVPGGSFRSILPASSPQALARVDPFRLDRRPVTHGEFLSFVRQHPKWQRGAAPALFVDAQYLSAWQNPVTLGRAVDPAQPVTAVSWFAARAYCEARGARLPSWLEWEFAAAADESRADARQTAGWQQQILNWYSRPANTALARVATRPANIYGVQDLHGLIWEWVEDFNALMSTSDARESGNGDVAKFCGSGALALDNPQEYAIAMRIALLSSLKARDTTGALGFRCVSP